MTTTAVSAIRNISNTISEINEVTTAIAAAVEEQGARRADRAQHPARRQGTKRGFHQHRRRLQRLVAGRNRRQVLTASGAMRREADVLREEIDAFLSNIRAA